MKLRVKPSKEQQALIEELIKDKKVRDALVKFGADMWQQGFIDASILAVSAISVGYATYSLVIWLYQRSQNKKLLKELGEAVKEAKESDG